MVTPAGDLELSVPGPGGVIPFIVGGRAVEGDGADPLTVRSPVTGEVLGTVPEAADAVLDESVRLARGAQQRWGEVPASERAGLAHRFGDAISSHIEPLARLQTLEQGKTLAESRADIAEAAELFHLHAEDVMRLSGETLPLRDGSKRMLTFRRPVGTWAIITPWNFPVLMMAEFVAPGLVMGNACVLKPPAHTAAAVVEAVRYLYEAGMPEGLVSVVPGGPEVGERLVTWPGVDAIGFIGSSATGERIQAKAGLRRTVMECSGNGPLVVLDDADLERAARAATYGAYFCSGQVCCATERVIVQSSVREAFMEAAVEAAKEVRLGDPFDPDTTFGPLNNEAVAAKVDRHLADARERGASVVVGGHRRGGMPTDLYYEYTLVDGVHPAGALAREETFGPVLPVLHAGSDDEILAMANADPLGLQGAVFTRDLRRAFFFAEHLAVGQVVVNDTTDYWDIAMPFGGAGGKRTGWGRIGGKWTLMDMSDLRTAIFDLS